LPLAAAGRLKNKTPFFRANKNKASDYAKSRTMAPADSFAAMNLGLTPFILV